MTLVDTNIISEMMRSIPSEHVMTWMRQQNSQSLFISTVSIAEISYGLNALPNSHRRAQLEKSFEQCLHLAFSHRILYFDLDAAYQYGQLMAKRKAEGHPLSVPDGQIAAIAISKNLSLATRNVRDFVYCDLTIINPFD